MMKNIIVLLFIGVVHLQMSAQELSAVAFNNPQMSSGFNELNDLPSSMQSYTSDFQQYWSFGGSLGVSFWDSQTSILIAPKAYYNVSPKFFTGFGITYIYSDYDAGLINYKSNSFGGSVMGAVRPIPSLQFDIEYEGLQTSRSGLIKEDFWNNALYLGASFVSGRVSFGFRYDILYDNYKSLYASAFNPVLGLYF